MKRADAIEGLRVHVGKTGEVGVVVVRRLGRWVVAFERAGRGQGSFLPRDLEPVTVLEEKREAGQDCGCARAGLMLNAETAQIERCDACALFDDDDAACEAVDTLMRVLGAVHRRNQHSAESTVADALDHLCTYAGIQ